MPNANSNSSKRRKLRDAAKRIKQSTDTGTERASDTVRPVAREEQTERSNVAAIAEQIGNSGVSSPNISGAITESPSAPGSTVDGTGNGNGRRRKRRSDAGIPRTRTGAGNSAGTAEAPTTEMGAIPIRKRRLTKKSLEESKAEKAAVLGLIAVGCNALYGTAALFLGTHWELEQDETVHLAKAIDNALSTLPPEYYGVIKNAIENYIPWIALTITAGAITIPRWKQTFNGTQSNDSVETKDYSNVAPIFGGDRIPDTGLGRDYTNGVAESDGSTDL